MEIIGWATALVIGLALGLFGGGGSTLTVPVLVYLFGIDPVLATAYSLFIVGSTAVVGAGNNYFKGLVDLKTAVIFGLPALVSVYLTRLYLVPAIPDELFIIGDFVASKSAGIMILFALLMIAASYSMIRGRKGTIDVEQEQVFNYPLILIEGMAVGLLTGLVGAGGGFLIIPALVVMSKLPMKKAVGTSLLIISAKSLFGFIGDVQNYTIDWTFLLTFASIAIVGVFVGGRLSNVIPGKKLKPAFGWFVLVMGMYILVRELLTA
jgi:hypothetical protein